MSPCFLPLFLGVNSRPFRFPLLAVDQSHALREHCWLPENNGPQCSFDQEVRAWLEETTPKAFARRNVFCGDRAWVNKYEVDQDLRKRRSA